MNKKLWFYPAAVQVQGDLGNMSKTAEKLKSQLSQLPAKERAELAHFLLHSLDDSNPEAEAAWDAELAERIQEIHSGKAIGEPAEKVFSELREKYS